MTGALKSTTVESKHLQIFTRPSLPIRYGELNDSWLTRHVRNGSQADEIHIPRMNQ